ncbi:MAG: OmpH family outer membrane protein [Gammaproteobacteria bacterium]|nr:OmpH family outer membrane protein [Gammaproteobacteria bacterium]
MSNYIKYFVAAIVMTIVSSTVAAESKVGFVDIQYVLAKSPQRVAIGEKLKAEFKEQYEELDKLANQGKDLQEKAQKDAATMSQDQRIETSRKLQELETQIKLKQKNLQEDYERRGQEEQRALLVKIQEQVSAVAKEEKVNMIVNKSALLWADQSLDLSEKVLAKMSSVGN